MKKMNKKGFTLIELLAVIVVLAIVMVIATQKITDVINSSRSNSFISSYKMIVKQINTNMVTNTDDIQCGVTGSRDCKEVYDISDDYKLTVEDLELKDNGPKYYRIELTVPATGDSKFKNLDLMNYGDAKNKTVNASSCNKKKVDSSVADIPNSSDYKAVCTKNKIVGFVAK